MYLWRQSSRKSCAAVWGSLKTHLFFPHTDRICSRVLITRWYKWRFPWNLICPWGLKKWVILNDGISKFLESSKQFQKCSMSGVHLWSVSNACGNCTIGLSFRASWMMLHLRELSDSLIHWNWNWNLFRVLSTRRYQHTTPLSYPNHGTHIKR